MSWLDPATAAGLLAAKLAAAVGLGAHTAGAVGAARVVALAVAAAVGLVLLWRTDRIDLPAALGWTLLAVAVLGPVVWPWYETWGLALVAVTARTAARRAVLVISAVGCFATIPSHVNAPGAAPVVAAVLLALGTVALAMADVAGKGVPAALLVSTVHAAVHLQIDDAKTVADLIGRVDRHLQRYAATRKFLTVFFGLIEPDSGALRYVSAGHNPALLRRADGTIEQLKSTGVPLGMFPSASWKEEAVVMGRGDLLCVYTDGVSEALDASDEEFGLDRLTALVAEGSGPAELTDKVFDAVEAFAAAVPQYDDQTLLIVRRA